MDYTVGELAKLSGLTVRALHHYEKLGLLHPSGRTDAGYRLFADDDVAQLHRILAYQQMGIALKDIAPLLGSNAPPLAGLLAQQIAAVEAQVERQRRLLAMLKRVEKRAQAGDEYDTDQLLTLMSMMRTYERHLDPADLQQLHAIQDSLGDDERQRLKAEFATLLPALKGAMERGAGPLDADVAALVRRLIDLGSRFPDNEALRQKMKAMVAREPGVQRETGVTPAFMEFIDQAVRAVKESP